MKQTLTIILAIFVSISLYGCFDDDPAENNGNSVSQIMFIHAEHNDYYWNAQNNEYILVDNTTAWGVVFGDSIPELTHIKLGETLFSGDEYYKCYNGYIGIGLGLAMITSDFTPLDVEIKTPLGTMNGTATLPYKITGLTLSEYISLELGEPFTISWVGSNADFYNVLCNYEWLDVNGYLYGEYLDEFVIGDSITFPGSVISHNGIIYNIRIQPMNGPFPEEGAVGNMIGEGRGFLYYNADRTYHGGGDIIVGSGLPEGMPRISSIEKNEQAIQERIREQIKNRILGNQKQIYEQINPLSP